MKKLNKKANLLLENIIFIVLNLVFLTILILFIYSKSGGVALMEEKYAKQIALIIDSAKPTMTIVINMSDALKEAEKEGYLGEGASKEERKKVVSINENIVTVKLREGNGYSYSFFNDVETENNYFAGDSYVLIIDKYKSEEEDENE